MVMGGGGKGVVQEVSSLALDDEAKGPAYEHVPVAPYTSSVPAYDHVPMAPYASSVPGTMQQE
eukprot:266369-Rhodomonas_salina.1